MKKTLFLIIVVVAFSFGTNAALDPELAPLKQATEKFMGAFSRGEYRSAIDGLVKAYWNKKNNPETAQTTMRGQIAENQIELQAEIGKPLSGSFEFIGTRRVGKSIVRLIYIQKYELSYLAVAFDFYKAESDWNLVNVESGSTVGDDMRALAVSEPAK